MQSFNKIAQSKRIQNDPRPTVQRYYDYVTTQAGTGKTAQEIIAQLNQEEAALLQECTTCSKSDMLRYALDLTRTHNNDDDKTIKKIKASGTKAYPVEQLAQQNLPEKTRSNALQVKHVLEVVYNIEPNSIEVYATPDGVCMAYFPNIIRIPYSTLALPFSEFTAALGHELMHLVHLDGACYFYMKGKASEPFLARYLRFLEKRADITAALSSLTVAMGMEQWRLRDAVVMLKKLSFIDLDDQINKNYIKYFLDNEGKHPLSHSLSHPVPGDRVAYIDRVVQKMNSQ